LCKLMMTNTNNSFGLGFRTTKCLNHLQCQNDFCCMFLQFGVHNEVAWSNNSSQLLFVGQCVLGLPTCTISYKFCGSSPFCVKVLKTCICRIYYIVHKLNDLSRVVNHLDMHAHLDA
jgi:hypothetical protein